MNPIAKIFAKPDGTFDIAALPMDPRQLVNILLSIAAAVVNRIGAPGSERIETDPACHRVDEVVDGVCPECGPVGQ